MGNVIGIVIFIFLFLGVYCVAPEFACSSKASQMGFKYDYAPFQGCMIKVENKWIPLESYRTLGD